uniref:Metalloendopeptidase n=1 Tax=Parastrongyloides trichosuri TaxID=131310 RepID=A0A0N5A6T4_PARTI
MIFILSFLIFLFLIQTYGGIITDPSRKWSRPIMIYVDQEANTTEFEEARLYINTATCVYLKLVDSYESISNKNGIYVNFNNEDVCGVDNIGKKNYETPNKIWISRHCAHNFRKILSLLYLTIGVTPEYDRFDRDDYVHINKDNVKENFYDTFFKKYDTEDIKTYGTMYDYGSLVHDSSRAFSIRRKETIKVIGNYTEHYKKMIGQRYVTSFNERKLVNLYYCSHMCNGEVTYDCQRSGYQRPQDCFACICPYPFYGRTCTEIRKSDPKCGSQTTINANTNIQLLTFNGNIDCYFTIQAPEGKRNEITVMSLELRDYSICVRGENNVEIKYKADLGAMGLCLCGSITQSFKIVSDNRFVFVFYRSTQSNGSFKFGVKAL